MPPAQSLKPTARLLLLLLFLASGQSASALRSQEFGGTGTGSIESRSDSRPYRATGTFAEVPNLFVEFNAGKDFDTVHARVMQVLRAFRTAAVKSELTHGRYVQTEKRLELNTAVSIEDVYTLKTRLGAIPGVKEITETRRTVQYSDTNRMKEELRFYRREKDGLAALLDTLHPLHPSYRNSSERLLRLIGMVSERQQELDRARNLTSFPCSILLVIYTNKTAFFAQSASEAGPGDYERRNRKTNWENQFVPGLSYNTFKRVNADTNSILSGFTPELTLYTRYRSGFKRASPAYVNVYGRLGIFNSGSDRQFKLYYTGFGFRLSFESKLKRQYLVPYFGHELGYFHSEKLKAAVVNIPSAGLYFVANKKVQAYAAAGYVYPFSSRNNYESFTLTGGMSFILWN
ncbi:MAG: hypothetical protein ACK5U7_15485 [Bacteroidota bacterium]